MELNFYKQPFRLCPYSDWVYDANNNFVFQFESEYTPQGQEVEGTQELYKQIIDSLNSEEKVNITNFNLKKSDNLSQTLTLNNRILIIIRGWGNLTGVGAHNFNEHKAAKIQDDFEEWLLYKLN